MTFFQNLSKVVSSQLFSKANSLVLPSCYRPVYLQTAQEETIDYVHSVRSLVKTIEELENLKSHQSFAEEIENELDFLHDHLDNYSSKIAVFVKRGGLLTGEGIANLYYSAWKLNLSPQWLETNVHHEITSKLNYMTRHNLIDTIAGVKKYHKDSPYLSKLEQELSQRPEQKLQFVSHFPNDATAFETTANSGSSHPLINTIGQGRSISKYLYPIQKLLSTLQGKYPLHSE